MAARSRVLCRPMASWAKNTLHDFYFQQAKKQGYVSRAAYKLLEIQKKHKVIKKGGRVLDLGCVPGAWLQVACQELGPLDAGGLVLGVDIQAPSVPGKFCDERVKVLQADARTLSTATLEQYAPNGFDAVLSDMLHFTSGVNDVERSLELASAALHVATGYYYDLYGDAYSADGGASSSGDGGDGARHYGLLRPGGALVMKVYEGAGTNNFVRDVGRYFSKVSRLRVEASRSMSREFYAIATGRLKPVARGGGGGDAAAAAGTAQQQQRRRAQSPPPGAPGGPLRRRTRPKAPPPPVAE